MPGPADTGQIAGPDRRVRSTRALLNRWGELRSSAAPLLPTNPALLSRSCALVATSNVLLPRASVLLRTSSELLARSKKLLRRTSELLASSPLLLATSAGLRPSSTALVARSKGVIRRVQSSLAPGDTAEPARMPPSMVSSEPFT